VWQLPPGIDRHFVTEREFLLSWYSTNKGDVVCCVNAKTTQMFHRYWKAKGTGDVRHRRRHISISVSAVTTRQITPSLRLWENKGLMRVLGCRYNMTHDSWSNDSESWYISYSMTTRWSPYIRQREPDYSMTQQWHSQIFVFGLGYTQTYRARFRSNVFPGQHLEGYTVISFH